jgi:hypothetical protein
MSEWSNCFWAEEMTLSIPAIEHLDTVLTKMPWISVAGIAGLCDGFGSRLID